MTKHIAGCMEPVIPLLMAGGLLKLVLMLLGAAGLSDAPGGTMRLLTAVSNAPFYFLPLLLAYASAVHFETNPAAAVASAGALMLPETAEVLGTPGGASFLGIPVMEASYAYSVLPVIFLCWFMSRAERLLEKYLRGTVKDIFEPFLLFASASVLGLTAVGPAGILLGNALRDGLLGLQQRNPVLAWMLLALVMPYLIMTGLHWVIETVAITNLGELGVDSGIMVTFLIVIMAVSGMCLAVCLRSEDKRLRTAGGSSAVTALFAGVVEPALYGVCLKEKRTLAALSAACALAGAYHGLVTIRCYVYAFPSLFSFLMFADGADSGNLRQAVTAAVIAFGAAFLLTCLLAGKKAEEK